MTTINNKNSSYLSVCLFAIFKVRKMLAVWFLLIVSLIIFTVLLAFIFFSANNVNAVIINFQYGVLIFTNIILLLFILLIIIKIFGREFSDGTYLLLISRPYSRLQIFILKVLTIWFLILVFIINLGFVWILIQIMALIGNKNDFKLSFQKLILELFLFSIFVSFLASSGIIFIATFLSLQTVLLIGFIFCSLFLLGGMPCSLISTIANSIEIKFKDSQQRYSIAKIKETLLFKEKLAQQQIDYYHITKAIYDFYSKENIRDLNAIISGYDNKELKRQRLEFYQNILHLTKMKEVNFSSNEVNKWYGFYNGREINEIIKGKSKSKISIKLKMPYFFKTLNEFEHNTQEHQELTLMTNYYLKNVKLDLLMSFKLGSISSLILYDKTETYFQLDNDSYKETLGDNFDPTEIFQELFKLNKSGIEITNPMYEVNDSNFYKNYEEVFNNPVLYVLKELENNIIKKIVDLKIITTNKIDSSEATNGYGYNAYLSLIKVYCVLSKINIIEHINQIWTSSIRYNSYWFEILQRSFIDFSNQKNYLMIYSDFALLKDENELLVRSAHFINVNSLLIFYLTLSLFFLLLAYLLLSRKVIT
ncbi:ABC transporter permease [Spiroplasma endosymbiont of Eupeodes luniger]|uniref:ABC transporter permease n=1 Tax=Spiroplasma endosymbiont of Eupeodes luniger TaxID=3066300 RepID=UPI0030CE1B49